MKRTVKNAQHKGAGESKSKNSSVMSNPLLMKRLQFLESLEQDVDSSRRTRSIPLRQDELLATVSALTDKLESQSDAFEAELLEAKSTFEEAQILRKEADEYQRVKKWVIKLRNLTLTGSEPEILLQQDWYSEHELLRVLNFIGSILLKQNRINDRLAEAGARRLYGAHRRRTTEQVGSVLLEWCKSKEVAKARSEARMLAQSRSLQHLGRLLRRLLCCQVSQLLHRWSRKARSALRQEWLVSRQYKTNSRKTLETTFASIGGWEDGAQEEYQSRGLSGTEDLTEVEKRWEHKYDTDTSRLQFRISELESIVDKFTMQEYEWAARIARAASDSEAASRKMKDAIERERILDQREELDRVQQEAWDAIQEAQWRDLEVLQSSTQA